MTAGQETYLVSFALDRLKLISYAAANGTIPRSGDFGYAIHQALTGTFGSAAPKPFHLFDAAECRLLAYSPHSASELVSFAFLQRPNVKDWELASRALNIQTIATTPLPSPWISGQRYRFWVRARPVSRFSHAKERGLPKECDVFLHAVASKSGGAWLNRQEVYLSWLRGQVSEAAAKLAAVRISSMKRTQVYRKGAAALEGPDVTFAGVLEVGDPIIFDGLMKRGIGRHRAFGFGMVLLGNV